MAGVGLNGHDGNDVFHFVFISFSSFRFPPRLLPQILLSILLTMNKEATITSKQPSAAMSEQEKALRKFLKEIQAPNATIKQFVGMGFTYGKLHSRQKDFRLVAEGNGNFTIEGLSTLTTFTANRVHRAIMFMHCLEGYPGSKQKQIDVLNGYSIQAHVNLENIFEANLPKQEWWNLCKNFHILDSEMYTISINYNVHHYRDLCVVMHENNELTNISQRTYSALMKVIEYIIETDTEPLEGTLEGLSTWAQTRAPKNH